MASGLFGSGPQSNILNTVAGSYENILNAEKQKGASMREAMGAFGKAIDPKTIGMNKFKKQFADADWTNPETYFQASQFLTEYDPAAAMSMSQRGIDLAKTLVPKKVTRKNVTVLEDGKNMIYSVNPDDPSDRLLIGEASASKGTEVTVNLDTGKQDPTKAQTTKLQTQVLNSEKTLVKLRKIGDDLDDSFLTYQGKVGAKFGSILDQLGVSKGTPVVGGAVKHAAAARAFKNQVQQHFNAYRKEITGAAAAIAELDRLEQSFLTDKNMGPETFKTVLNQMEGIYVDGIEELKLVLREGIDVSAAFDPSNAVATTESPDGEYTQDGKKFIVRGGLVYDK